MSRSAPVSKFVSVASQMSRPSYDLPISRAEELGPLLGPCAKDLGQLVVPVEPVEGDCQASADYAESSETSGSVSSGSKPMPRRDLFARRPRPLAKSPRRRSPVAGRRHQSAPTCRQVLAQLRRADPGAQVVGRVEARVHVREVVVARVADAGRLADLLRVAVGRAAVLVEACPESSSNRELRRVAAEEQRLEEDRRLRVLARLLVREPEVLGVPAGLAGDRLEDERVDLGQRVVARKVAERVREVRIAAA